MMVTRGEAARLLRIGRSLDALCLGATLVSRFALDRLRYKRGTRLVLGNALAARLFRNLLDRRVAVWFSAKTTRLISEHGRACGLAVERAGSEVRVDASRGIVLAGGGFPASPELRERYLPKPVPAYTSAFAGCAGDTLLMAQEIGAALGPPGEDNSLWFPSSIATRKDGSTAVYPHIILDRGKPGLVAVNAAGRRFVNEAVSYHEFTRAMYRSHRDVPSIPAWLVCDRRFIWKYGLGMIRPLTPVLRGYVRRGYLKRADSVGELARTIGVDVAGLVETIRTHNEFARTGVDAQFGKGKTPTTAQAVTQHIGRTRALVRSSDLRSVRWRCFPPPLARASACLRTRMRKCSVGPASRSRVCTLAGMTCIPLWVANIRGLGQNWGWR